MKVELTVRLYAGDIRYCSKEFLSFLKENADEFSFWDLPELLKFARTNSDYRIYDVLSAYLYSDGCPLDSLRIVFPKRRKSRSL